MDTAEVYEFEKELERSNAYWDDCIGEWVSFIVTDDEGAVIRTSEAFDKRTKIEVNVGMSITEVCGNYHGLGFYHEIRKRIRQGMTWEGSMGNIDGNGNEYWMYTKVVPLDNGDILWVRLENTHEMKRWLELKDLDRFSGLVSQEKLLEDLKSPLQKKYRSVLAFTLKEMASIINQYTVGDVRKLWNDLRERFDVYGLTLYKLDNTHLVCVREYDSLGNTGFVLEEVKALVKDPFLLDNHKIPVTVHAGLCIVESGEEDCEENLLRQSEWALARSVEGNWELTVFSEVLEEEMKRELQLKEAMVPSMENQYFYMVYQPKYRISEEGMCGVEALLRWNHPDMGMIYPNEFIPLAEREGYMVDLGMYVLEEVCKQLNVWRREGIEHLTVGVNLSVDQLKSESFVDDVRTLITRYGVEPSQIELEIVESMYLKENSEEFFRIQELKYEGFKISIDDFGKEYSSLSYLLTLKADDLKIDKMYVDDIETDETKRELIRHIIQIGELLGMRVVAEGVENEQQLKILESFGCEYIQGYYYSRPLEKERIQEFYTNEKQEE